MCHYFDSTPQREACAISETVRTANTVYVTRPEWFEQLSSYLQPCLHRKGVLTRLNLHMTENNLRDQMQSAHREQHSTETALMKVQHDIVHNLDSGHCVMLVLLDTSAAFDTINIDMLLNTLHLWFGIGRTAHDWFKSYLTGRSQHVAIGSSSSTAPPSIMGYLRAQYSE